MNLTESEKNMASFAMALLSAMAKNNETVGLATLMDAFRIAGVELSGNSHTPKPIACANHEQMAALAVKIKANDTHAIQTALREFADVVENLDGVEIQGNGLAAPRHDAEWTDLGEAYLRACDALGRAPVIRKD